MNARIEALLNTQIGEKLVNKIIWKIKKYFFRYLKIQFVIEKNIVVPLCFYDSVSSFSEIFIFKEYEKMRRQTKKWIDLGSNNGFFSLFIASKTEPPSRKKLQALLIDGDERSAICLQEIKKENKDLEGLVFKQGIIARGSGEVGFEVKDHMFSKINKSSNLQLSIITQEQILKMLVPPYDLIKVDIEGSEVEFIKGYPTLLKHTKALIVEWHSWNAQQISKGSFRKLLLRSGFSRITSFHPRSIKQANGQSGSCLTFFAQK